MDYGTVGARFLGVPEDLTYPGRPLGGRRDNPVTGQQRAGAELGWRGG